VQEEFAHLLGRFWLAAVSSTFMAPHSGSPMYLYWSSSAISSNCRNSIACADVVNSMAAQRDAETRCLLRRFETSSSQRQERRAQQVGRRADQGFQQDNKLMMRSSEAGAA
jgi:hypothetical protein